MDTRVKKIITKTANVLVIIIGVFILFVAISAVSSFSKGYSSAFGYTAYSVRTESMVGDNADSFNKGDLIIVKLINEDEKADLTVNQIITFFTLIDVNGDGQLTKELNTHRIVEINEETNQIITQGDNNETEDAPIDIDSEDIVGVYSSKIPWIGNISLFINTSTGFLVCIVIPSVLVVAYCVYLLLLNLKAYNIEKKNVDMEKMRELITQEMKDKDKDKE